MPPDDSTKVICRSDYADTPIYVSGTVVNKNRASAIVQDVEWTYFTDEAWREVKNGSRTRSVNSYKT
jgi:hypothetical protein